MNVFGDWDFLIGIVLVIFAWRRYEAEGATAPLYDVPIPFIVPAEDVSPDDPADRVGYPVEPCLFFGALLAGGCVIAIVTGQVSAAVGKVLLAIGVGAYALLLFKHYRHDRVGYYPVFLVLFSASLVVFTVAFTTASSQVGAVGGGAFLLCTAGAHFLGGRFGGGRHGLKRRAD